MEMEDKKEAILINTLDISAAGKNCKVLLGDINGDGRMELVCAGERRNRFEIYSFLCHMCDGVCTYR